MARKYRKRRRRYRPRSRMRMRRYRRRAGRPEVKYITIQAANPTPFNNVSLATPNATLYRASVINSIPGGFLASISQGPAVGQRIGNSIFLKSISIRMVWYICPAASDTNEYSSCALRTILSNAPITVDGSTDYSNFWSSNSQNPINSFINRENIIPYIDNYSQIVVGWSTTGSARVGDGGLRRIRLRHTFNRTVTYTTSNNVPKNSRDILTLSNHAFSPNTADGAQVACAFYSVRVYFTDI